MAEVKEVLINERTGTVHRVGYVNAWNHRPRWPACKTNNFLATFTPKYIEGLGDLSDDARCKRLCKRCWPR